MVKLNINVLSQTRVTLSKLEIEHIKDLNSKVYLLMEFYLNRFRHLYTLKTIEDIEIFKKELDIVWNNVHLSYGAALIFIGSEKDFIGVEKEEIFLSFTDLTQYLDNSNYRKDNPFKKYYLDYIEIAKSFVEIRKESRNDSKSEEEKKAINTALLIKIHEFNTKYKTEITAKHEVFILKCRDRIKKLAE